MEHEMQSETVVVNEDGEALVASRGDQRVELSRRRFGLSVSAGMRPVLRPPAGPREEDVFSPSVCYAGISYCVDGAIHGGYVATGRRRRWYRLTEVLDWSVSARELRLRVSTDDPVGREADVLVAFEKEAIVVRVMLDSDDAVVEIGCAGALRPDEDLFGLGERFVRSNHRGSEIVNWLEDACIQPGTGHDWTYWPVPYFVSSEGYGVHAETSARAVFRLGSDRDDAWSLAVDGARLDVTFLLGPTPADVVRQFTGRTGRPVLPPPWALGVWKTVIGGDESVIEQATRLRDHDMGVSAVWLYDQLELETNSGWGSGLGFPTGTYTDIPGMIDRLHDAGLKVLGYLNPHFIPGRPTYEEGEREGFFAKRADGSVYLMPGVAADPETDSIRTCPMAMIDFTDERATRWWQAMLERLLTHYGYDGWMEDFGEYLPADSWFADGRSGWEARNAYPLLYHRASAEIRSRVDKDTAVFVRSGYTGSNAYATAGWPGDQHTDWTLDRGLPGIVPAALSLGLSGQSTWGPDIGGYFDDSDGSGAAASEELWIRWCEFGALTPLMRDHLGQKLETESPVTAWSSDRTQEVWRRMAALHNRLFPYLYAHAVIAHETGVPIMRHFVLAYPDDAVARRRETEYLLGADLLAAPVLEPGVRSREAYLPTDGWYRLSTGELHRGAGLHTVAAALGDPPLLARAGSIVPMLETAPASLTAGLDELALLPVVLQLFPAVDARAEYGSRLPDGSEIAVEQEGGSIVLQVDDRTSGRPLTVALPDSRPAARFEVDGREAALSDRVRLPLPEGSRHIRIELELGG